MDRNRSNKMDVTQDEVSKLTKAMKDEKFKGYMDEYCRETSDPKHRAEYLKYLDQLEAKGEMPDGQALLRTQPGICVKTRISFKSGQTQKCFINIVHSDQMDDLRMDQAEKGEGHKVHLPYSLSPPRPDRDHGDEYCMTCDLAVSTRTFYQATQDPRILKMLVDTAADGLGTSFLQGFEEVMKDFKVMRRMQCKGGAPMPMSVRRELLKAGGRDLPRPRAPAGDAVTPTELRQMRQEAKSQKQREKDDEQAKARRREAEAERARKEAAGPAAAEKAPAAPRIRVPKHHLVHSGSFDLADLMETETLPKAPISTVPRLLRLVVELPSVKKSGDVNLEVTSLNVVVEVAEKYYLDLPLPYEIDEAKGSAKFDKVKQTLTLEMPVIPKAPDPNVISAAAASQPAGGGDDDQDDRALSEGRGASSDEELPPLESEEPAPAEAWEEDKAIAVNGAAGDNAATQQDSGKVSRGGTLEFGEGGNSLHIPAAAAAATAVAEVPSNPNEDDAEQDEGDECLPDFVASECFDGARPGYAFKTGDSGLGYYRDLRQAPLRNSSESKKTRQVRFQREDPSDDSAGASAGHRGPLVTEVVRPTPAAASALRTPLPVALQRYAEETSTLRRRVADADCESGVEDVPAGQPVSWHQTRQNLTLLLEVADGHEVADVQLLLADRRIVVSFCTRLVGRREGSGLWRRHRLRRVLCGPVDPRQWHAELTPAEPDGPSGGGAAAARRRLVVLLRKADQAEVWAEAFDACGQQAEFYEDVLTIAAASAAAATDADRLAEETDAAAEPCDAVARPSDAGAGAAAGGADAGGARAQAAAASDTAAAVAAASKSGDVASLVDVAIGDDSAALDAAAPVVHRTVTSNDAATTGTGSAFAAANGGDDSAAAASALAQSAAVMGQSVLLRTRLMYQLL